MSVATVYYLADSAATLHFFLCAISALSIICLFFEILPQPKTEYNLKLIKIEVVTIIVSAILLIIIPSKETIFNMYRAM